MSTKKELKEIIERQNTEIQLLKDVLAAHNIEFTLPEPNAIVDLEKQEVYEVLNEIIEESKKLDNESKLNIVPVMVFANEVVPSNDQLKGMTLQELKNICRSNKWKGFSKLSKSDLVDFIIDRK
jgi:hypothetical protein